MTMPAIVASGDPVLYAMLGGLLLLVGGTIALGSTGVILLFGKSDERRTLGRRLMMIATIPLIVGAAWWIMVVGFD
jgi:hypothetical protein